MLNLPPSKESASTITGDSSSVSFSPIGCHAREAQRARPEVATFPLNRAPCCTAVLPYSCGRFVRSSVFGTCMSTRIRPTHPVLICASTNRRRGERGHDREVLQEDTPEAQDLGRGRELRGNSTAHSCTDFLLKLVALVPFFFLRGRHPVAPVDKRFSGSHELFRVSGCSVLALLTNANCAGGELRGGGGLPSRARCRRLPRDFAKETFACFIAVLLLLLMI